MKFLPHLLACLMLCACLAACADEGEDAASESAAPEQASEEQAAPEQVEPPASTEAPAEVAPAASTGDDRRFLVNSCLEAQGTTPDMCECIVDGLIAEFSAEEFGLMADAVRQDPNLPGGVPGIAAERLDQVLNTAFDGCGLQ